MVSTGKIRIYDRHDSAVFLKTNERFGGLSNMAPGYPLLINGVRVLTSEAIYQASRFPHLPDVQRMIIRENSPMTAKMRSKPYRSQTRPDWDFVRVKIMKWCLRVKLAQNWTSFSKLLLETGSMPIVEQSRRDDYWGSKVSEDGMLVGMNILGRLLMELREEIKNTDTEHLMSVLPPSIPEFMLYGRLIDTIKAELYAPVENILNDQESVRSEHSLDADGDQWSLFEKFENPNSEGHASTTKTLRRN